jgi:hypothetical protein
MDLPEPMTWNEYGNGGEWWDSSDRFQVMKSLNGWYCLDTITNTDSGIVRSAELAKEWAESRNIAECLSTAGCGQSEEF